ncbi:MAG TPA: PAS domain S-box protein [Thermoanaerobaculia bacterium]|nr:PAS domain S-box protein [Thermoanaerobaculia bacterium]
MLAAIVDSSDDAIIGKSLDGTILSWNSAAVRMYGYSAEEVIGRPVSILTPPERRNEMHRILEAIRRGDKVDHFETERIAKDGRRLRISLTVSPIRDRQGRIVGASKIARDIGDRKRAEDEAERARRRLFEFLDNLDEGFFILGPDWRFLYLNQVALRLSDESAEELVGRTLWEAFPALIGTETEAVYRRVMDTRLPERFETRGLRSGRWFEVRVYPSLDGLSIFSRDFTDRKRAEDELRRKNEDLQAANEELQVAEEELRLSESALRQSEERFRDLADAVPSFVWTSGPDGLIGFLNERWYAYTGLRPEQSLGTGWVQALHPEDVERSLDAWEEARRRGDFYEVEMRYRRADGEYRWFIARARPVRDDRGRIVAWFGSSHDVHDRKLAEEAKDRFLATLSHELRTPLTPVLAVTSNLEGDARLPADAREALSMVRRNVELEARLIDDLLDLTRIARGKIELHPEAADARRILEHALETSARQIASKALRLETDLAAGDHRVWADSSRLTQVFWNLLTNAVKFTPAGGTVRVRSWTEEDLERSDWLAVEVVDDGIGIEPELLPRIFDAFEQGERGITRRYGGLGLGLAVSKAIIDLHGGRISAASAGPGRGAAFTVRLPVREQTAPAVAAVPAATGLEAAERSLHVLLVEDHDDTAEAMADLLRASGHRVTVADTVAAALEAAAAAANGSAAGPLDFVVSDLGLPDGNGHDLMRELARRHGLRGIALSGYGMEEDVRRSREAGFSRHLTKPVSPQLLRSVLREAAEAGGG